MTAKSNSLFTYCYRNTAEDVRRQLRALRKAKGLSITDLVKANHFNKKKYHRMENGNAFFFCYLIILALYYDKELCITLEDRYPDPKNNQPIVNFLS